MWGLEPSVLLTYSILSRLHFPPRVATTKDTHLVSFLFMVKSEIRMKQLKNCSQVLELDPFYKCFKQVFTSKKTWSYLPGKEMLNLNLEDS